MPAPKALKLLLVEDSPEDEQLLREADPDEAARLLAAMEPDEAVDALRDLPAARSEVERYARYREVKGGIQWPHEISRERNGDKTYQIFSDSVSIDQNLTDNYFSPPGAVKKTK